MTGRWLWARPRGHVCSHPTGVGAARGLAGRRAERKSLRRQHIFPPRRAAYSGFGGQILAGKRTKAGRQRQCARAAMRFRRSEFASEAVVQAEAAPQAPYDAGGEMSLPSTGRSHNGLPVLRSKRLEAARPDERLVERPLERAGDEGKEPRADHRDGLRARLVGDLGQPPRRRPRGRSTSRTACSSSGPAPWSGAGRGVAQAEEAVVDRRQHQQALAGE